MISRFYDLLSLSLSITFIIIILLLLSPFLKRRYSARWRYILWIVISIRLLLPFPFEDYIPISFKAPNTVTKGLPSSVSIEGYLAKINSVNAHEVNISLGEVLFIVYCVGVIVYLFYEIISYIGFRKNILRWSKKPSKYETEAILLGEKERLKIKRNVPILISKKVSSPMLIGLVKPILIIPSEIYTLDELKMVIIHELVHLKRNDIWFKAIFMLTVAVHWFNPFVYLMVIQANKVMEQSCDEYVLKEADLDAKRFYCNIILKIAATNNNNLGPIFSTNIINNKENLEMRIKNIIDNTRKRSGILTLITIILIIMLSGAIVSDSNGEQLKNLSTHNETLYEPTRVRNDILKENKNEISDVIKDENDNKNQIISRNENDLDNNTDEINQPLQVEDEAKDDNNSSIIDNRQLNNIEKQEEIIVEDDVAEIVIVDLNQLENQLNEEN